VSAIPALPSVPAGNRAATGDAIFGYVLVGVDTTPESVIAAAQAKCLSAPGGYFEVLAVAETHLAVHAGFNARHAADELVAATREELEFVRELAEPDQVRFVAGSIAAALVAEAKRQSATLIALGTARHRRLTARLFGGADLPLLREAPCSVLVARAGWGVRKPRRILVGVDGSAEATGAEEAARALASRLDCELTPVIALGGKPVEHALLRAERKEALLDPRSAVDALISAPEDSLVILGSHAPFSPRGVSAHVAHEAACSVLVVKHDTATGSRADAQEGETASR
jgi:nucleotide-binding universal stress UspA family protein